MTFSTELFAGVTAQQAYTFTTLRFLSSTHLSVTVDGVEAAFTVNADRTVVTVTGVTIAGGEDILVTRRTPSTEAGRLVNFQDLSHVRQSDLDTSSLQLLYLVQEALDFVLSATALSQGVDGQWDAESLRIENVDDGVDATDAVNKSQLDLVSVSAGNLPVVGISDNDKSLWVVGGVWFVRTPAQARTHLGLGTAALLTAGVLAGNVVQLDGSARYPANDGRNIDLANNAVTTALNLRHLTTLAHILQAAEATPALDASANWSESAGSRLSPGAIVESIDNASDIVLDNPGKKVTLSAGTWAITYVLRAYNVNGTAGDDQDLRVKITNDDDTAGQIVYDTEYDRISIESPGPTTRALFSLNNTLLVKLPAGGTIVLRAVNEDGVDIRINTTRMIFEKVSTAT